MFALILGDSRSVRRRVFGTCKGDEEAILMEVRIEEEEAPQCTTLSEFGSKTHVPWHSHLNSLREVQQELTVVAKSSTLACFQDFNNGASHEKFHAAPS